MEVPANLLDVAELLQDRFRQSVAAAAGERKRLHHHGADFPLDIVAQHAARAMQPRFHSLWLQLQRFGSLLDAQALDHARTRRKASGSSSIAPSTTC